MALSFDTVWYCTVVLFGALNATPEATSSREYRDDFVRAGTIAIPLRVFDQAARSPELNAPVRLVTLFRFMVCRIILALLWYVYCSRTVGAF